MAEIETKVTADTAGAAQAMGNVAGATSKFTGEVRTARGALHEFHGISHLVSSVMTGNLTGAVRGASIAMRGLTAAALNPLTLGLAAAVAGIYAAARAWGTYFEQQEKARQVMKATADQLQQRHMAARADLYPGSKQTKLELQLKAAKGDWAGIEELRRQTQEKSMAAAAASQAAENDPRLINNMRQAGKRMQEAGGVNEDISETRWYEYLYKSPQELGAKEFRAQRAKITQGEFSKARGQREAVTTQAGQNADVTAQKLQEILEFMQSGGG